VRRRRGIWSESGPVRWWRQFAALLRLAGSVLVEAQDEWQVADKRYLSETSLALLHKPSNQPQQNVATPGLLHG